MGEIARCLVEIVCSLLVVLASMFVTLLAFYWMHG
jgi:hypothetical protein